MLAIYHIKFNTMDKKLKERCIHVCGMVNKDLENDVQKMDGKPLTGRNVAEMFGYQAAAIKALSEILIEVLKSIKDE